MQNLNFNPTNRITASRLLAAVQGLHCYSLVEMSMLFSFRLLLVAIIYHVIVVLGSIQFDLNTNEDITTFNGQVGYTSCPAGKYRPGGSSNLIRKTGQREDGCVYCPRGRYGATEGLELSTCTGPCPLGKYGAGLGLKSAEECIFCPRDTFSSIAGISSVKQCEFCPAGKYTVGLDGRTNSGQCKTCPKGYHTNQCTTDFSTRAPKPGATKTQLEKGIKNGDYAR